MDSDKTFVYAPTTVPPTPAEAKVLARKLLKRHGAEDCAEALGLELRDPGRERPLPSGPVDEIPADAR